MPGGKHVLAVPKGRRICGTVKVGEKGQIVIPKEVRNLYNINSGDTLFILAEDESGFIVTAPDVINNVAEKIFDDMKKDE